MKRTLILMLVPFILACGGDDDLENRVDVLETTFNKHRHHVVGDKTSEPIERVPTGKIKKPTVQTGADLPQSRDDGRHGTDGDHTPPPRIGKIAFESGGEIFLINTDGTERKNITQHGGTDIRPKWRPDGQKIAFLSDRAGTLQIFNMNPDGTDPQLSWRFERGNEQEITEFDWSPDMNTFIYAASPGLFIHDKPHRIHWHRDGTSPAWSNRGQIAFVDGGVRAGQQEDIFVTNQFGGAIEPLITTFEDDDKRPAWSNDGAFIAFDNAWNIFIANADGTGKRQLTLNQNSGVDRYEAPTWSPDGKQIAFAANREPEWNWEIYIINADGTGQYNLTNTSIEGEKFPDWQL